jgi:phosphoglycerol transferase MdoB-like AlkP superfamily enzyme
LLIKDISTNYMRERIRFILIYFTFWAIYFLAARVIFLAYHIEDSKLLTLETVFGIFWNGFRMDLSMAGYLSLFPFLWVTFSNFIKKSVFQSTIFTYTFILVFIITLIIIVDLEVYNIWSFRIDATPLGYLKSPREAIASITNSPVIALLISFLALMAVSNYIMYRIMANKIDNWKFINNFPFIIYGLLFSVSLIIPIRGGFGIAPMNHSTVYFSNNNFANISALNAPWNFLSSVLYNTSNKVNPFTYLPKEILDNDINKLYKTSGTPHYVLKNNTSKPNVLIIMWESFTKKIVGETYNGIEITPNFNKLRAEGIYFDNLYASGDRTDKALVSVLSAYPAQPTTSIIKQPLKSASLPVITKVFEANGYTNQFYYGGDTEFANIKSYLFGANFNKIVDKNDFPEELNTSKWGVHDEFLFEKFLNDHKFVQKRPFFSTLLTLSSHEPFETSRSKKIEGNETLDMFMNSMNYTDEVLGEFIENAKKQPWWDNTIIVIIADHGNRLPETKKNVDDFKIPMLWLGGPIKSPLKIMKVGSQIDLASTLLHQLKFDASKFVWSKDILNKNTKPWAFYAFNNGFGYIKPEKVLVFDNVGKRTIETEGKILTKEIEEGKSMQQRTFEDYLKR